MSAVKNGEFPVEDALQQVIQAALENEETISKSADVLRKTSEMMQHQAVILRKNLASELEKSAICAANAAARHLTDKMEHVNELASQAYATYEAAVRFSYWRVCLHALVCCFAGVAGMVATAWLIIPDAAKMQALREEKVSLERGVAALSERGGRVQLTQCRTQNGASRLCVRTDESSSVGPWGKPPETYRIICGY